MKIAIGEFRKALWHLRQGGPRQFQEWYRRSNYESRTGGFSHSFQTDVEKTLGLQLPAVTFEPAQGSATALKVAVILDDFSARAWGPEWDCTFITPTDWQGHLESIDFDLLFVESAWAGNNKAWQYHLTGTSAPRPALIDMVTAFKAKEIPAVFWNKEDPPHFEDFLDCARLFDFVLTSDERKIVDYRRELGHDKVAALSFAAQPVFHNPVRPLTQERRDVAFAGMYFAHKFPERREQMEIVLGGAADVSHKLPHGVDIFSRQHGGDEKYQFPAPYDQYVVGSLDYDQMLSAYKYYNVFLNVNSVVDSPSMCARRIFEITAAGSAVVSAPSAAISNFFDSSEVLEVSTREDAANAIRSIVQSPELRDRMVHLGQRRIWTEHTYAHRAREIEAFVGLPKVEPSANSMTTRPNVTAVVSTIRPHQIEHIISTVASQLNVDTELILVTHGFSVDPEEFETKAVEAKLKEYKILELSSELSLGDCLNAAVAEASGDFITKMDDDDLYGENYLFDQVSALRYSGASVVGKQAHFMYLGDSDATLLRFAEREHRFTNLVMGPTMLGHASVFKNTPFASRSRGEDTQFLRDVIDGGGTVYSSDRFNFMQMRSGDGKAHTWGLSDAELTATGKIQWFGRNDKHLFF
ncbi:glycosyltransferase family protein [Glutamicibacter ardleyensis]|uniref:glycosyltransferase family protein n=1 Tax=Glutamicibacter ardleyensis TaxID=225894 RepID=UPI003FD0DF1B